MIVETVERWIPCREGMLKAIAKLNGTHTEDGILIGIMTKRFHLLTKGKTGIVLEVVQFECFKALNVFLVGGDVWEAKSLFPEIERIRQELDCKRLMALDTPDEDGNTREKAWQRLFGAKPAGVFMYRDYQ